MGKRVFYKGFTLIDGTGREPLENSGLLVEDKSIIRIGKANEFSFQEDTDTVELKGKTIVPGMIDCHVHITMEPIGDPISLLAKESSAKTAVRSTSKLKKILRSGITYFRDLGGPDGIDIDLRNSVKEGLIEGPEFLVSALPIVMTGGHGWQFSRECDGIDEARKAAREQLKAGADVLKIMATGGVMTPGVEPGSPQLTKEEMKAAITEAHRAGKKTASHAQGTTGIKNAILAGIDSIEHGIFLDDETVELMIEEGVFLVPTLVAPFFIVENGVNGGIPQYAVEKAKRVMDSHFKSFRKAKEAGVKIAMGTDAGTPFNVHGKYPHELKLMVEAGMTPMEAIVAATKYSSELLGIDKEYGTLEEGKTADFLVLKENPLKKLDALFEIDQVYKLGKLIR